MWRAVKDLLGNKRQKTDFSDIYHDNYREPVERKLI